MKYQIKTVTDLLYRSRVPKTWAEVELLQKAGITTIINLISVPFFQKEAVYHKKEHILLQKYGIKVIYIPLHLFKVPTLHQLEEIFKNLENLQEKTLIHCKHGVDRTGMAIAYWQVKTKAKSIDDAIKEMLEHGFHRKIFKWWIPYLDKYVSSLLSKETESDPTNQP